MNQDILTVIWKESKGVFQYQGNLRAMFLNLIVPIVFLGMLLPYQEGVRWVDSFFIILVVGLVPVLTIGLRIPDSFAGERERHTLGTLLASRLPDRAILIGKMSIAILYGWLLTLVVLLIGIIVVNITEWTGSVLFYPLHIAIASSFGSLLLAIMIASLGVLISIRAETVQKASQTLIFAFLSPLIALQVGAVFIFQSDTARETIARLDETVITVEFMSILIGIFLLIDIILIFLVDNRFKRARLLLV
jgi:ABC-2 type transport system permease protein